MPWRSIMARSAARLRRDVGPLSSRNAGVGQTRQRDITGNNRTSSEHRPNIVRIFSNIVRTYSEHSQAYLDTRGSSRAVALVAGSRAVGRVACGMACRRIACGMARRPLPSRPIPAPLGDRMSLRCSRSGAPKVRRQPCPGPTAPVADAATGGFETFFLLHGRGALSWPVRRRG